VLTFGCKTGRLAKELLETSVEMTYALQLVKGNIVTDFQQDLPPGGKKLWSTVSRPYDFNDLRPQHSHFGTHLCICDI
jgi:hypothetical protein